VSASIYCRSPDVETGGTGRAYELNVRLCVSPLDGRSKLFTDSYYHAVAGTHSIGMWVKKDALHKCPWRRGVLGVDLLAMRMPPA